MKKYEISIGITTFNEQENIKNVLSSLLAQSTKYYNLKEIILITDGCTDNTYEIANKINSKRLKIIKCPHRVGQTTRQNQIIKTFKGDILVFVEADTLPENKDTLDNLIRKFYISDTLQVAVGGDIRYFGNGFYERIQKSGSILKNNIFQRWNAGQNIYWLGGHSIKALRRNFAKSLNFPKDVPEDTFIYLHAKNIKARMERFPEVNMLTGITKNFCDWVRQSNKFITGKNSLAKYFGEETVDREYEIPLRISFSCIGSSLKRNPFWTLLYILFLPLNRFFSNKKNTLNPKYEIYTSTKTVSQNSKPVLIISNYDDIQNPYYGGGGAIAVHEVAKRLTNDYGIRVLTGNYRGAKNKIIDGVNYQRIGLASFGPYIGQISYTLALPFKVLFNKYDIWVESFTPPFSTGFTPLFTKKPVVALVHMLSGKDMQRKYKLPFRLIENIGLKLYQNFIVTSDRSEAEIKKVVKKANFFVIPNGVDIPQKKVGKEKHILYIGRIEIAQKGLDLLLEAQNIAFSKTKVPLVIAGTGYPTEVDKLKDMIAQKGLQNEVKYTGKIYGAKKEKAFRDAIAVALPSRFDTYPLVALESMAHAKPLVMFDINSLSWIPQDTALRAKPFDTKDFAKKLIRIEKNPILQLQIGKNAIRFARTRSWQVSAKQFSNVLSTVQKNRLNVGTVGKAAFNF